MAKATSIKDAIAKFERDAKVAAAEAEKVDLCGQVPPIDKMDGSLAVLKSCRHLALSTNSIEKISNLNGLDALETLSLGRNLIKKIENLEVAADRLQQLWISYNLLERFTGIEKMGRLRVLLASNNRIRDWAEVDRLAALASLEDLLLLNNPLVAEYAAKGALAAYRIEVVKRLPQLKKLDGTLIDVEEREAAKGA